MLLVSEMKHANLYQIAKWLIFQSQAACPISWVEKVIFERWEFQARENALGVPPKVLTTCAKMLGLNIKNLISRCFVLLPERRFQLTSHKGKNVYGRIMLAEVEFTVKNNNRCGAQSTKEILKIQDHISVCINKQ